MKKVILSMTLALVCMANPVKAQFVTVDPLNILTSILNTTSEIVQTSSTVSNVINNWKEVEKVYKQGKEYYDKLKAVNDLVKDAKKVRDCILMVGEIGDMYYENYQKMLSDPNFRYEELVTIANGYSMLLEESGDMLVELKEMVNVNGLSMTDHERMDIINKVYDRLRNHRNLVNYYTRKNISISYLRAMKTGETERVITLYGSADERYW